jgi:hypothetical protein
MCARKAAGGGGTAARREQRKQQCGHQAGSQDPDHGASMTGPLGWAGTWQIHETIRKLDVLY